MSFCTTHHITSAPSTATVVHDMKVASFAYHGAVKHRSYVNTTLGES